MVLRKPPDEEFIRDVYRGFRLIHELANKAGGELSLIECARVQSMTLPAPEVMYVDTEPKEDDDGTR